MIGLVLTRPGKKRILIVAGVAALFVTMSQTGALASKLTASWSYDYEPQPACSSPQSKNCIDHFEVLDITDTDKTVVIQSVNNATPSVGKEKIVTSFNYGPPFGNRTISVVAIGRDLNLNRVSSNPYAARVTVFVRPRANISLLF